MKQILFLLVLLSCATFSLEAQSDTSDTTTDEMNRYIHHLPVRFSEVNLKTATATILWYEVSGINRKYSPTPVKVVEIGTYKNGKLVRYANNEETGRNAQNYDYLSSGKLARMYERQLTTDGQASINLKEYFKHMGYDFNQYAWTELSGDLESELWIPKKYFKKIINK